MRPALRMVLAGAGVMAACLAVLWLACVGIVWLVTGGPARTRMVTFPALAVVLVMLARAVASLVEDLRQPEERS